MNEKKELEVPSYVLFGTACISGVTATLCVQPLDLLKTRMQMSGEGGNEKYYKSSWHAFRTIVRNEGVLGLYSGLTANLLRQATSTTCRMGLYQLTMEHLKKTGHDQNLLSEIGAGSFGGFVGALIAAPAEVALVRMTADGNLPPTERRNYKNIFEAFRRIAAEESKNGVFAGFIPSVLRSIVANTAQLVSYSQAKQFLERNGYMENDVKCQLVSSLFSGFVFSVAVCPFDVAKTRMQYMQTKTEEVMYKHLGDALIKIVQREGVTALWKGFVPLLTRCAPHTVILLVLSEQLTSLYVQKLNNSSHT